MSRNQWILAGVLGLQVLLIVAFRTTLVGASTGNEPRKLLGELAADAAVKVELTGGDEPPITLERQGAAWAVAQLDGFPADGAKIEKLLEDLKGLTVRRPVVTSARYHETFKVEADDSEGRVRVWTGEGEPAVDLIVGSAPNYGVTNVRRASDDAVFEAQGLQSYDVRSATTNWIRKEIVDAKQEAVVGIAVTNAAGGFELKKDGDSWKVVAPAAAAGQTLDAAKVDDLVRVATSLRLADAVGKRNDAAQGFGEPAATVVLRWTESGTVPAAGETPTDVREQTIQIGAKLPDKDTQRYIGRADSEFTGAIWDSSVSSLIDKTLADVAAAG